MTDWYGERMAHGADLMLKDARIAELEAQAVKDAEMLEEMAHAVRNAEIAMEQGTMMLAFQDIRLALSIYRTMKGDK